MAEVFAGLVMFLAPFIGVAIIIVACGIADKFSK